MNYKKFMELAKQLKQMIGKYTESGVINVSVSGVDWPEASPRIRVLVERKEIPKLEEIANDVATVFVTEDGTNKYKLEVDGIQYVAYGEVKD